MPLLVVLDLGFQFLAYVVVLGIFMFGAAMYLGLTIAPFTIAVLGGIIFGLYYWICRAIPKCDVCRGAGVKTNEGDV